MRTLAPSLPYVGLSLPSSGLGPAPQGIKGEESSTVLALDVASRVESALAAPSLPVLGTMPQPVHSVGSSIGLAVDVTSGVDQAPPTLSSPGLGPAPQ